MRLRLPIVLVLVFGSGLLMVLAVTSALWLGLRAVDKQTQEFHRAVTASVISDITADISNQFRMTLAQANWIIEAATDGRMQLDNLQEAERFLNGSLGGTPYLTALGLIYPDGRVIRIFRDKGLGETLDYGKTKSFRQFYAVRKDYNRPTWGPLFWSPELQQTLVNLNTPIRLDGKLKAILVQTVSTARLSQEMQRKDLADYLVPFILYDRTWVLAHPAIAQLPMVLPGEDPERDEEGGFIPLPKLAEFEDQILSFIWEGKGQDVDLLLLMEGVKARQVTVNGRDLLFVWHDVPELGLKPWTVGVYIDVAKTQAAVKIEAKYAGGAGVVILVLSVLAAVLIGMRVTAPIRRIALAALAVKKGRLMDAPTLPTSKLWEFDMAASSFNAMIEGLKEKELIREVFGKYVPEKVAAILLEDKGRLDPVQTVATVLFVDLAGFTGMTEKLGPGKTVDMLNAYFSEAVGIIEAHDGVITQFQGDAILATFNVPLQQADHAERAIRTGLELLKAVREKSFAGEKLSIRIGINTGDIVAAAVGAEGRLNYTVHGDVVNVAARLEQMNKQFDTMILVTGTTLLLVDDQDLLTMFDKISDVDVRGKTERIAIHALKESKRT